LFWNDFDLTLTFGQPWVNQGNFGQFGLKWHFGNSDARTSCIMLRQSRFFHGPMKKK